MDARLARRLRPVQSGHPGWAPFRRPPPPVSEEEFDRIDPVIRWPEVDFANFKLRCRRVDFGDLDPEIHCPGADSGKAIEEARGLQELPLLDRAEFEGRLLAGQPIPAVAARFRVSELAIKAFKGLCFDIDDRVYEDLLYNAVPESDDKSQDRFLNGSLADPGTAIRFFALIGGLQVMEAVLEVLRDPGREFDLATAEGLRAARRWARIEAVLAFRAMGSDDPKAISLLPVFDRIDRQLAEPSSRRLWKPLQLDVAKLAVGPAAVSPVGPEAASRAAAAEIDWGVLTARIEKDFRNAAKMGSRRPRPAAATPQVA